MKNLTKVLALFLVALALLLCFASCKEEPLVIKDSDTFIVIKTTEEALDGKSDMKLIDYMEMLRKDGELEFEVKNGMITSINGQDNPTDFSKCWMLYTSDEDFSSSEWGTVEYKGTEYGSAIFGAEMLVIKPNQTYIWVFKSFE